jgi:hypothetical protein
MFCLLQDRLQILSLIVTLLTLFYGILLNTNLQQFQLNDKNERSLQVIIFQDRTKMSFKPPTTLATAGCSGAGDRPEEAIGPSMGVREVETLDRAEGSGITSCCYVFVLLVTWHTCFFFLNDFNVDSPPAYMYGG